MKKVEVYQKELEKLNKIFKDVEKPKRKLVEGLIEDAAFLKSENAVLKDLIKETGMIKIHPRNKAMQKPTEAAKQYLKNVNTYSTVIKALNGILQKNIIEQDDEFDEFMKNMKNR